MEVFDDRVEVTNAVLPVDRFIDENQSRNEHFAATLRSLRVCDERGHGIDEVVHHIEVFQLPPFFCRLRSRHTTVILSRYKQVRELTSDEWNQAVYQQCCLRYVINRITNNEFIRERFGMQKQNAAQATRLLNEAVAKGLIRLADPACGTGGFFLSAYDYLVKHHPLKKDQKTFLKTKTFHGNQIVPGTRRLCLMNLFLHNIGEIDGESLVSPTDALVMQPAETVDYVLANPPFGKKSSMTFTNEEGEQEKDEFTYNRQDFLGHHLEQATQLPPAYPFIAQDHRPGRRGPARQCPLEGGAGETVRRKLMEICDLHTIFRLPTGIFYAQGVKANVLFFDNRPACQGIATKEVRFYDHRTNIHHTLKRNPLRLENLCEFIDCYRPAARHQRRPT